MTINVNRDSEIRVLDADQALFKVSDLLRLDADLKVEQAAFAQLRDIIQVTRVTLMAANGELVPEAALRVMRERNTAEDRLEQIHNLLDPARCESGKPEDIIKRRLADLDVAREQLDAVREERDQAQASLAKALEINQEQLDAPTRLAAERDYAQQQMAEARKKLGADHGETLLAAAQRAMMTQLDLMATGNELRAQRSAACQALEEEKQRHAETRHTLNLIARTRPFVDRLQDMAEAAVDLAIGTDRLVKALACVAWHSVFPPAEPWRPAPFKPEAKTPDTGDAP